MNESYLEKFHRLDPWVHRGLRLPGVVRTGDALISDSELLRTEFYNEYLRPLGVFHMMGAAVSLRDPDGLAFLGIHRAPDAGQFSDEQKRELAIVVPHLRRALQMRSLVDGAAIQKMIAQDALDALGVGMLLLGPDCRIVFANQAAESLMAEGGAICGRNGTLRATADAQPRFEQLVRAAATHYCGSGATRTNRLSDSLSASEPSRRHNGAISGTLHMRDTSGRMVSLLVCPLDAERAGIRPPGSLAAVFVEMPGRKPSPARALAELYGLTPAELRLITALLDGERPNDYADRTGISRNTIKSQLAQLFAKTGTNRQSELMRMMSGQSIAAILEHWSQANAAPCNSLNTDE